MKIVVAMSLVVAASALSCSSGSGNGTPAGTSVQPASSIATTAATVQSSAIEVPMPDKKALAAALRSSDEDAAEMVEAPETELTRVPSPFFTKGGLVSVLRRMPAHPVMIHVGFAGDVAVSLTSSPESFHKLAAKAGLVLDLPEQRNAYVTAFFETTRPTAKRFWLLSSMDEVKARPNLSPEDQARFDEIVKKHSGAVKPLSLDPKPPYKGSLYVLAGQDLVRIDVELGARGEIRDKREVVEKDVPIPYAR